MKKNAICILANNLYHFKTMVDNFPVNIDEYDVIVVNETRIGNKIQELRDIYPKASVIDSMAIISCFERYEIENKFLHDYTMGMNILMQWFVFKYSSYEKVLFLDDDVIINDLDSIFALDHSSFIKYFFISFKSYWDKLGEKQKKYLNEFAKIFKIANINENNYRDVVVKQHVNGGQFLICRKDFAYTYYEECLRRFFNNEFIHEIWKNRRGYCVYFIDQFFISFFAYSSGISNNDLKQLVYCHYFSYTEPNYQALKRRFNKYSIIHNATNSHKKSYYERLKLDGVIK